MISSTLFSSRGPEGRSYRGARFPMKRRSTDSVKVIDLPPSYDNAAGNNVRIHKPDNRQPNASQSSFSYYVSRTKAYVTPKRNSNSPA